MKHTLILLYFSFIAVSFFYDDKRKVNSVADVIWGSNDPQNPMRIILDEDKTLTGAANQTLVINGYVDITHKEDLDDAENIVGSPVKIIIVYDHIRFKANSKITTKSHLVLTSLKTISGVVIVSNVRGVEAMPGSNGQSLSTRSQDGDHGGSAVKGANASVGNSASIGPPGGNGGNGTRGVQGGNAEHGHDGGHSGALFFDINEVLPGSLFKIMANGGAGGKGGDGGRGQDGGNGGHGGKGGDGGNSNIPGRDAADGGSGGNGGDGGDGGNGGAGGNGGNGGDGGVVQFFSGREATIAYLNSSASVIDYQIDGGKRGTPGLGGAGGIGGKGGNGGPGGGGGNVSRVKTITGGKGNPGRFGPRGNDGQNGLNGPIGRFGQNGRRGKFHIPEMFKKNSHLISSNGLFKAEALGSTPKGLFTLAN